MWSRLRTIGKSWKYAWNGVRFVYKNEQNFRIQSVIAVAVIIAMVVFQVKPLEAVALTGMIVMVLILEIMNTVVERFIDLLKPRMHHYSGSIKDMMAAAVLLTALAAAVIGALIFIPYIEPYILGLFS